MKKIFNCLIVALLNCLIADGQTAIKPFNNVTIKRPENSEIITGADRMQVYLPLLKGKTVAVFANPTSMVGNMHLVDTLLRSGIKVVKIFGPEHGFRGDADAGEHVGDAIDKKTGLPVISL